MRKNIVSTLRLAVVYYYNLIFLEGLSDHFQICTLNKYTIMEKTILSYLLFGCYDKDAVFGKLHWDTSKWCVLQQRLQHNRFCCFCWYLIRDSRVYVMERIQCWRNRFPVVRICLSVCTMCDLLKMCFFLQFFSSSCYCWQFLFFSSF